MSKTKKIAILAIIAMVLTLMPTALFAATADSTRLEGTGRIGTALDIASAGTWGTSVVLAPADDANLVDALAAAPLAGQENAPILLTFKGSLDAAVKAKIVELKATKVYVVGAISDAVAAEVDAIANVEMVPLKGAGRQATADAVNAKLTSPAGTFVVGYDAVPDALSVASYAAKNKFAIVLANADGTVDSAKLVGATKYIVGGTTKVKDIAGVTRLSGIDRYTTNADVASKLGYSYDRVYVANGVTLVDALAVAPLAAKYNAFVALASSSDVAAASVVNAKLSSTSKVIAVGGANALSAAVVGKVAYAAPATLVVESVTAINGKQIQVVFSKAVDETAAELGTNYKITDKDGAAISLVTDNSTTKSYDADLKSDEKTVILTLASAITKKTDITVVVTKSIFADADNSEFAPLFSKVITVEDKVAPDVTLIESKTKDETTKDVTVTFTEPVASAAFKIDGKSATATWEANNTKAKLVATDDLKTTDSHKLEVVNATDGADNVVTLISKTFSITSDTVAPQIVSVTQYSDQKVLVEFDKKMTVSTLTGNANILAVDSALAAHNPSSVVEEGDGSTDKLFVVTLSGVSYSSDDTEETFTLSFSKNITDSLGNELTAVTKQITLKEDKVKPSVVSTKVVKDSAGKVTKIEVLFDESLSAADVNDLLVVDKNGVEVTSDLLPSSSDNPAFTSATTDGKKVNLILNAPYKLTEKFTFTFKKGFASDASIAANENNSYTATIDFGAADADKFELTGTPVTSAGNNAYYVDYDRAVKGGDVSGSATNVARYTLNGSTLPAGTTITLNSAREVATITLPSGSVTTSDSAAIFTIIGVQDLDDNTIVPYTTTVNSIDNIKPVLQSASLFSYDNVGATPYEASILLTFDENMSIVDGTDVSDELAIKVGGNDKAITTATAYTVVGKAKQIRVDFTFATSLDTNKTITIKTLDGDGGINDASTLNNEAKADVTVTVVK